MRSIAFLASAVILSIAALHCRKPPPNELVYTGRSARPSAPMPATTPPVDDPGPGGAFSKEGLLTAIGDCAIGRYRAFEEKARVLRDATNAYRDDRTEPKKSAAREAWLAAIATWQENEIFRFGPQANAPSPGARSLRDSIYVWPQVSRCKAEEQIVSEVYAQSSFNTSLVNGRGLGTYEYLLFYVANDNACSAFSAINAQGSWNALGAVEVNRRKGLYAAAIGDDVLARAEALIGAWAIDRENFYSALINAGKGSAVYASQQDAFNAINEGLFFVEKEVKDAKLGRPLGFNECAATRCPEAVESPFAHASVAHLKANLIGFRKIFQGCGENYGGLGFDDWLRAMGAGDLADRMLGALVATQVAIDALDSPLEQTIALEPARVEVIHTTLRGLTDPLKTEFVTVLNLELPRTVEGDND